MLPTVRIGRHGNAQSVDPDSYRSLVYDALIDQLTRLAKPSS